MGPLVVVLVLVLVGVLALCLRRVGPDERLVVLRHGRPARISGPGLTWVVPLLDSAHRVGTQPRERWAVAKATTVDGVTARVQVEFAVRDVVVSSELRRLVETRAAPAAWS